MIHLLDLFIVFSINWLVAGTSRKWVKIIIKIS